MQVDLGSHTTSISYGSTSQNSHGSAELLLGKQDAKSHHSDRLLLERAEDAEISQTACTYALQSHLIRQPVGCTSFDAYNSDISAQTSRTSLSIHNDGHPLQAHSPRGRLRKVIGPLSTIQVVTRTWTLVSRVASAKSSTLFNGFRNIPFRPAVSLRTPCLSNHCTPIPPHVWEG